MKYISDFPTGFRVRFAPGFSRFFGKKRYGSMEVAYLAAVTYRDAYLETGEEQVPPPPCPPKTKVAKKHRVGYRALLEASKTVPVADAVKQLTGVEPNDN